MKYSLEEQFKIITKGVDTVVNEDALKEKLLTAEAMDYYNTAFRMKGIPDDIPELVIDTDKDMLEDVIPLLTEHSFVSSNSEFRRLIKQGGVRLNEERIEDIDYVLFNNDILKIGKKKFVKIIK